MEGILTALALLLLFLSIGNGMAIRPAVVAPAVRTLSETTATPPFLVVTCACGNEALLKEEVKSLYPDSLKSAFQRPGLVTFKTMTTDFSPENLQFESCIARSVGISLGSVKTMEEIYLVAITLQEQQQLPLHSLRLHVFARGEPEPGGSHPTAISDRELRVREVYEYILKQTETSSLWATENGSGGGIETDTATGAGAGAAAHSTNGDKIHTLSVIVPTGPYIDDPLFLSYTTYHPTSSSSSSTASLTYGTFQKGIHRGRLGLHAPRYPGGLMSLVLPPQAPSRAWLKMEEVLAWSALPIQPNDVVVEIGSAPGGAAYSLLSRGLRVIGIDPEPDDRKHADIVINHPRFTHIKSRLSGVTTRTLLEMASKGTESTAGGPHVEWLVCDANVSPEVLIDDLNTTVQGLKPSGLLGCVFTLKMGDDKWKPGIFDKRLSSLLNTIAAMGFVSLYTTHLGFGGQEVVVVGLTTEGMKRTMKPKNNRKSPQ